MKTKILIDTNILIALEDQREVAEPLAALRRKAGEFGLRLFVHEATDADIGRDKDAARQRVTRSKARKFEALSQVHVPPMAELEVRYGSMPRPNDVIDASLLHALDSNLVDLLVSEDIGLHRRAARAGLAGRVLTVREALTWIKQTYEPSEASLPAVEEVKAYSLDRNDPIFDGLRADYGTAFDPWLDKCVSEHRACWVVRSDEKLAALVIRKDETHADAGTKHPGSRIMKLCTFKVAEGHRGEKLGELLLKQVLWHAQRNGYDLVYLTAFPSQSFLTDLLSGFGFHHRDTRESGELVLEKQVSRAPIVRAPAAAALDLHRAWYPRFVDDADVGKFVVPIRGPYHRRLFPEWAAEGPALPGPSRRPGNTIRKVYLCRARARQLAPGDILLFYLSRERSLPASQALTTIAIVESVRATSDAAELIRWTAKRSVFSAAELEEMAAGSSPVTLIDFYLAAHLEQPLGLAQLVDAGVLRAHPQSIVRLGAGPYGRLRPLLKLGYDI